MGERPATALWFYHLPEPSPFSRDPLDGRRPPENPGVTGGGPVDRQLRLETNVRRLRGVKLRE